MKFEKYLFGVFINSWGVAKYSDGEKIKLIQENVEKRIEENEKTFESIEDYEKWIDWVLPNFYEHNEFKNLNRVLMALDENWR